MEPMKLDIKELGDIVINGHIRTFGDYEVLKKTMDEQIEEGADRITLHILQSQTIISSVIGYLIKIVNLEQIPVHLFVKEDSLAKVITDLGLADAFLLQKID